MTKASDETVDRLRQAILEGELKPSTKLGEVWLTGLLGVSRTPVREALARLASEGLVELSPHRGARVARWSPADLEEIFELRLMLEVHAAFRAATRMDSVECKTLESLCGEMEACFPRTGQADVDRLDKLNREFHRLVIVGAASPRLSTALSTIVQVPLVTRTFHLYSPEALLRSLSHHRDLTAALSTGDADWARAVMRSHILAARSVLLGRTVTN
ncbi:MAG: GntR family transcriptional regulator [Acidimicrobiales bacterium]